MAEVGGVKEIAAPVAGAHEAEHVAAAPVPAAPVVPSTSSADSDVVVAPRSGHRSGEGQKLQLQPPKGTATPAGSGPGQCGILWWFEC